MKNNMPQSKAQVVVPVEVFEEDGEEPAGLLIPAVEYVDADSDADAADTNEVFVLDDSHEEENDDQEHQNGAVVDGDMPQSPVYVDIESDAVDDSGEDETAAQEHQNGNERISFVDDDADMPQSPIHDIDPDAADESYEEENDDQEHQNGAVVDADMPQSPVYVDIESDAVDESGEDESAAQEHQNGNEQISFVDDDAEMPQSPVNVDIDPDAADESSEDESAAQEHQNGNEQINVVDDDAEMPQSPVNVDIDRDAADESGEDESAAQGHQNDDIIDLDAYDSGEDENAVVDVDDNESGESGVDENAVQEHQNGAGIGTNLCVGFTVRLSPVYVNVVPDESVADESVADESGMVPELYDQGFFQTEIYSVASRTWTNTSLGKQHYLKGVLWSPDGSCCLVPVNDEGMHIINLPDCLWGENFHSLASEVDLPSAVFVKEENSMYDFSWFPMMTSDNPQTCCWIATSQMQPIHLFDAYHGQHVASYRGYDTGCEVEAAISCAFNQTGSHIYAGYKKCIRVFDTNIPGTSSTFYKTNQAISCLAPSNDYPTSDCIVGTWDKQILRCDMRSSQVMRLFQNWHSGGITLLKRLDERNTVYSGARKDDDIFEWDLRFTKTPRHTLKRKVTTNQRIYFDLSPQNSWLASGSTDGCLYVYETKHGTAHGLGRVQLYNDVINGVSFNSRTPIIALSTGQYHNVNAINVAYEESNDIPSNNAMNTNDPQPNCTAGAGEEGVQVRYINYENVLSFVWLKDANGAGIGIEPE